LRAHHKNVSYAIGGEGCASIGCTRVGKNDSTIKEYLKRLKDNRKYLEATQSWNEMTEVAEEFILRIIRNDETQDKEKMKKLGVFVPYADFKGNINEALNKLIGDLKKFGYSNAKNVKPEQVKLGWGEHVCAIIDELLNLELYRREF
jgi:coproporphyrinogen III oxidase-like Fe-S oxidoreductase